VSQTVPSSILLTDPNHPVFRHVAGFHGFSRQLRSKRFFAWEGDVGHRVSHVDYAENRQQRNGLQPASVSLPGSLNHEIQDHRQQPFPDDRHNIINRIVGSRREVVMLRMMEQYIPYPKVAQVRERNCDERPQQTMTRAKAETLKLKRAKADKLKS